MYRKTGKKSKKTKPRSVGLPSAGADGLDVVEQMKNLSVDGIGEEESVGDGTKPVLQSSQDQNLKESKDNLHSRGTRDLALETWGTGT